MLNSQVEEVKNKLDVVEVIGGYIKLKKTGANYRGVCPFHSEKTPSFFVSPARQMWKCFGCGAGSSIFDFVMQIEGVEFGDALRILAQKAGVELKQQNPQLSSARQKLYEICELSCKFFEKQLEASIKGKEADKYLLGRGINKESIKKWRLGYSPNTWQGLSDFLVGKGYTREELERAGLVVKSETKQNYYDRFRGRIIFPVFDLSSQVIGFGARVFEKDNPPAGGGEKEIAPKSAPEQTGAPTEERGLGAKYINTPQTLLYDKSHTLYGLNFSKIEIRKENRCVITEGYTDTIMAHQAGFGNTIAVSGTALTPSHLIMLKRYTENLLLAFDMDIAGDNATKRSIGLAQEAGFNIKIIKQTKADSDPADVIKEDPKEWQKSLDQARSILDFYFDSATAKYDKNTPEGKKEIGRVILPAIKRMPNKIEQSFWVQKLATTLSVAEQDVIEELKKTKIELEFDTASMGAERSLAGGKETKNFLPVGRKRVLEEKIISLILKNPENLGVIDAHYLPFFSEKIRSLLEALKQEHALSQTDDIKKDFKKVVEDLIEKYNSSDTDPGLKEFLATLALRAEVDYEEGDGEVHLCLLQLKSMEIRNRLKEISAEIKKAEQSNKPEEIDKLMGQFNELTKEL